MNEEMEHDLPGFAAMLAGSGVFDGMPQEKDGDGKRVSRDAPEPEKARAELVKNWLGKVQKAKEHWSGAFEIMRRDANFVAGRQWAGEEKGEGPEVKEDSRYKANITLRHINQRVSSLYAKNPKVRAERKPKLYSRVWDGSQEMLMAATQGLPSPEIAMMVIQDAASAQEKKVLHNKIAKTLEIVAQYSLDEPIPKFKTQAKQLVRRALTCYIGYCKLGYQRIMEATPDVDAKIKDATDRLLYLQQLADDFADGELVEGDAEIAELKQNIAALQQQKDIVLREGVVFSFPKSWRIIVDPCVVQLKGFIGAEWVAQEYLFTPDQVQRIYGKSVGKNYTAHTKDGDKVKAAGDNSYCAVYEVYDLTGQTCFTICEGYPDYLKEPGAPDVDLEQFHPFYTLTFNDIETEDNAQLGPSNAALVRPMQLEYNRAREALRVHRIANRPAHVAVKGVFGDKAKNAFASHMEHEVIELEISKNDDIEKLLKPKPVVPIDPALYDVEGVFNDTMRVAGDAAANLGGTSGATATESTIAETSRGTSIQSNIDDLDEFLTDLMRGVGQVLLLNMGEDMVKRIAGDGATWPTASRREVAEELMLAIKAGSSGKPNQGARIAAIEKVAPFLLQVPGVKPQKVAEFLLRELDENIDVEDFMDESLPSIVAMNANSQPNLAPQPGGVGQAAMGAANSQNPMESAGKAQNMNPLPGDGTGQSQQPMH